MRSLAAMIVALVLAASVSVPWFLKAAPSQSPLPVPGVPRPSPARDDAAILGIIEYAHTVGLESAEAAQRQGHSGEVRDLARGFFTAHTHGRDEVRALGIRLQLRPVLPDSDPLARSHAETMTRLEGLEGRAFDRAWADYQVGFHQRLIERVKHSLIPSAAGPELREYLQRLLPALLVHLDEARSVQERIVLSR